MRYLLSTLLIVFAVSCATTPAHKKEKINTSDQKQAKKQNDEYKNDEATYVVEIPEIDDKMKKEMLEGDYMIGVTAAEKDIAEGKYEFRAFGELLKEDKANADYFKKNYNILFSNIPDYELFKMGYEKGIEAYNYVMLKAIERKRGKGNLKFPDEFMLQLPFGLEHTIKVNSEK